MRTSFSILLSISICFAAQSACAQTKPDVTRTTANTTQENHPVVVPIREKTDAGEIDSAYPAINKQAEILRRSFMAEDFERYADFMHPVALEAVGGKKNFAASLSNTRSSLRRNGFEFVSYTIGDPVQLLEIKDKLFAVLPYETKMRNSERTTTEVGNILAVSESNGKDWKFIRASSKERLRFLYPDVVDLLKFAESRAE